MAMREAFTVGVVLAAKDMYSGVMAKAQRNLGILRKTSKDSADAFEKSFKRFQGILAAGATISIVSAQLSRKIQEMTRDAIDFSGAMGKIGTVILDNLGKFKSHRAAMEAWRTKALEVSTRSLYSATELIDNAAYNLMSSGLKADVAMDLLESVGKTSIATIGDLETTSALFGKIMNTFATKWDMSSLEMGQRIFTDLSTAVKKFQWTGNMVAESLSWATTAAEGANLSFEETLAALGMMTTKGWGMSKAGMAIQTFIREVSKASKKLGITVTDTSGQMLPIADILEKIHKRFGELNLAKQDKLVAAFGARGARLVQILYGEHEALRQNTKALGDIGVANAMVEERMKTLSAETKMQEHRWKNLRIELGDKAAPVILDLKRGVLELIDAFGRFPGVKDTAGLTLGIVGLAAEIGKTIGPAVTMVGVFGMWRTQAALAAAAQASLNAQMGASAGAATAQAMRMGMLGSRGMALVGVLGKVSAVGAAAFIGWEIGTVLRRVLNLDEGVQKLFATLTGAKIGDEFEKQGTKAMTILKKLRDDMEVTEEEVRWFAKYMYEKTGKDIEETVERMRWYGIGEARTRGYIGVPRAASIQNTFQGGINITLSSTGVAQADARNIAGEVMREINHRMMMEERMLP